MALNVAQMMAEANAVVPRIDPAEALEMIELGKVLVVDVREAGELAQSGKVKGAVHVPRSMIEFRADPASPAHLPEFQKDRPVILYCGTGGRSALAGKVLKDFGFAEVYNLGGFSDWASAGLPTERV